jgi:hypothetical protein
VVVGWGVGVGEVVLRAGGGAGVDVVCVAVEGALDVPAGGGVVVGAPLWVVVAADDAAVDGSGTDELAVLGAVSAAVETAVEVRASVAGSAAERCSPRPCIVTASAASPATASEAVAEARNRPADTRTV